MTEVTQITGSQINELEAIKRRLNYAAKNHAVRYEAFGNDEDEALYDLLSGLADRVDALNQAFYRQLEQGEKFYPHWELDAEEEEAPALRYTGNDLDERQRKEYEDFLAKHKQKLGIGTDNAEEVQ